MGLELSDVQKHRLGKIYHLLLTLDTKKNGAAQDEPNSTTRTTTEEPRSVGRSSSKAEYDAPNRR